MTDKAEPIRQPTVETKHQWTNDWTYKPHLRPLSATVSAAPTIPTATFEYLFGEINDGHAAAFDTVGQIVPAGTFVRIQAPITWRQSHTANETIWTGVITGNRDIPAADDNYFIEWTGDQSPIIARGLEFLLTKAGVYDCVAKDTITDQAVRIQRRLTFNAKHGRGMDGIAGNRSTAKFENPDSTTTPKATSYIFSDDGAVWTHRDIIEYLITWYAPTAYAWAIDTTYNGPANLDHDAGVQPMPQTVYQGVNAHANRRRGHTWHVEVSETGNPDRAMVCIAPAFADPVGVGETQMTGGGITLEIDGTKTAGNQAIQLFDSVEHAYDRIEVVGQPILLLGTFDSGDFDKAWSDDAESAYESDGNDRKDRGSHIYADVFRAFTIKASAIEPGPECNDAGSLSAGTYANQFQAGKGFTRQIPLRKNTVDTGATPEYRPMFGAVYATVTADNESAWIPLDELATVNEGWPSITVTPMDGRFGFRLNHRPQHVFGLNHYTARDDDTREALMDYNDLIITAAWYSDERLRVVEHLNHQSGNFARVLRIEIPDAQAHYQLPNTTTHIANGNRQIEGPGKVLVNDSAQLQAIAAQAKAWYQRSRRAARVQWANLKYNATDDDAGSFQVGALLTYINDTDLVHDVRTPVTSIAWDFQAATTVLQTDFAEIDYSQAVPPGRGGGQTPPMPVNEMHDLGPPRDLSPMQPANLAGMAPAAAATGFFALITGTPVIDGTNKRWSYPISQAEKTAAGHDGWSIKSGGRTGTAYNLAEVPNSDSGMAGTGIDQDNLTADEYEFALMPLPYITSPGKPRPIWVRPVPVDGIIEYWFSAENSPDGWCVTGECT